MTVPDPAKPACDASGAKPVCYFGAYNNPFPRNTVIRTGLERCGVSVVQCCTEPVNVFTRYAKLAVKYFREARGCSVIVVGEGRHWDVPLARLLGALTGSKVILDAFISHYDSWVLDRPEFRPHSRQAVMMWFADYFGAALAHRVLMDTHAHIDFYCGMYPVAKEKFVRVISTTTDDMFFVSEMTPPEDGKLHVMYQGSYLPLHGMEYIVRAAKLLEAHEDIVFHFVGDSGYVYDDVRKLHAMLDPGNIVFHPRTDYAGILEHVSHAHVCLGIFGTTGKASRVIPNKAFEAIATRRALVTADTPGIREAFVDRRHAMLCKPGDPEGIAAAVLELKNDPALRQQIAQNGYDLYLSEYLPQHVVQPLLDAIGQLTRR